MLGRVQARVAAQVLACAVAVALSCAGTQAAAARPPPVTVFAVPGDAPVVSGGITAGPDGGVWFTAESRFAGVSYVDRVTANGISAQYQLPNRFAASVAIVTGPDGALWFTEGGTLEKLARLTTAGALSEYMTQADLQSPGGVTVGPDGAIWFTDLNSGSLLSVLPGSPPGDINSLVRHHIPAGGATAITTGGDGALWFNNNPLRALGRLLPPTPTRPAALNLFPLTCHGCRVERLTRGPDNAIWFTERGGVGPVPRGSAIGRIGLTGKISQFQLAKASGPFGIAAGSDGSLYFTEQTTPHAIGRIASDGRIGQLALPPNIQPKEITLGPDNAIWFTVERPGAVARVNAPIPFASTVSLPRPPSRVNRAGKLSVVLRCDGVLPCRGTLRLRLRTHRADLTLAQTRILVRPGLRRVALRLNLAGKTVPAQKHELRSQLVAQLDSYGTGNWATRNVSLRIGK